MNKSAPTCIYDVVCASAPKPRRDHTCWENLSSATKVSELTNVDGIQTLAKATLETIAKHKHRKKKDKKNDGDLLSQSCHGPTKMRTTTANPAANDRRCLLRRSKSMGDEEKAQQVEDMLLADDEDDDGFDWEKGEIKDLASVATTRGDKATYGPRKQESPSPNKHKKKKNKTDDGLSKSCHGPSTTTDTDGTRKKAVRRIKSLEGEVKKRDGKVLSAADLQQGTSQEDTKVPEDSRNKASSSSSSSPPPTRRIRPTGEARPSPVPPGHRGGHHHHHKKVHRASDDGLSHSNHPPSSTKNLVKAALRRVKSAGHEQEDDRGRAKDRKSKVVPRQHQTRAREDDEILFLHDEMDISAQTALVLCRSRSNDEGLPHHDQVVSVDGTYVDQQHMDVIPPQPPTRLVLSRARSEGYQKQEAASVVLSSSRSDAAAASRREHCLSHSDQGTSTRRSRGEGPKVREEGEMDAAARQQQTIQRGVRRWKSMERLESSSSTTSNRRGRSIGREMRKDESSRSRRALGGRPGASSEDDAMDATNRNHTTRICTKATTRRRPTSQSASPVGSRHTEGPESTPTEQSSNAVEDSNLMRDISSNTSSIRHGRCNRTRPISPSPSPTRKHGGDGGSRKLPPEDPSNTQATDTADGPEPRNKCRLNAMDMSTSTSYVLRRPGRSASRSPSPLWRNAKGQAQTPAKEATNPTTETDGEVVSSPEYQTTSISIDQLDPMDWSSGSCTRRRESRMRPRSSSPKRCPSPVRRPHRRTQSHDNATASCAPVSGFDNIQNNNRNDANSSPPERPQQRGGLQTMGRSGRLMRTRTNSGRRLGGQQLREVFQKETEAAEKGSIAAAVQATAEKAAAQQQELSGDHQDENEQQQKNAIKATQKDADKTPVPLSKTNQPTLGAMTFLDRLPVPRLRGQSPSQKRAVDSYMTISDDGSANPLFEVESDPTSKSLLQPTQATKGKSSGIPTETTTSKTGLLDWANNSESHLFSDEEEFADCFIELP